MPLTHVSYQHRDVEEITKYVGNVFNVFKNVFNGKISF